MRSDNENWSLIESITASNSKNQDYNNINQKKGVSEKIRMFFSLRIQLNSHFLQWNPLLKKIMIIGYILSQKNATQ